MGPTPLGMRVSKPTPQAAERPQEQRTEDVAGGTGATDEGAGEAAAPASAPESADPKLDVAPQRQSLEGYATFLAQFYTVFKPENLSQIPAILKQYEGREEHLYEDLHKKYKPNYEALICKIYSARNPEKLAGVPELLSKHKGKEFNLFLAICTKYKVTNPNRLVVALNGQARARRCLFLPLGLGPALSLSADGQVGAVDLPLRPHDRRRSRP